ncbi:N-formylglutamate amidohydrolase [Ovoidimarina sediminis]|uniref:N-formylglutamate amidohydrolase n=1 Tax=Ovoidimarina sediminis TaxID=3079856 RepID=UPI002908675E|nr:N-formylglutamate amidohydrolase [Rhodophyticola sp. MJ-SS7]MDU8942035.1 N-formylglutamate amidohydrolase [Rhodophyticola sp. MJ-SS7]
MLIVCEHASRHVPDRYGDLGLGKEALSSHIAWDIGALDLARDIARRLGAPLINARVSRLVYDLNRPPEVSAAIPDRSEIYDIPANRNLDATARAERVETTYRPWREALAQAIRDSGARALITVHSFTPVYFGERRETTVGILHDRDLRLADIVLEEAGEQGREWDRNSPYGPEDGVTHTVRIAEDAGLLPLMIEVRNDLLATPVDIASQGASITQVLLPALDRAGVAIAEAQS